MVILTAAIPGIVVLVVGVAPAQQPRQQQQWQQQQWQQQQWQQQQQMQQKAAADAKNAADAKKAADAKTTADDKAASAKERVAKLGTAVKAAQQEVDVATKTLKTREEQVVSGQSTASDFGKAREELRETDTKYQDARKSVLESDSFKDRLAKAQESDEPATVVLALKKEFYAMPEIAGTRTRFQETKEKYQLLRTKLLQADPVWINADKSLKDKKNILFDLKRQFAEASKAASNAKRAAQNAAAAAATAEKAVQSAR